MIIIASRRIGRKKLHERYPGFVLIDVTSKSSQPWVRLSPFYPHKQIPIPFSPGFFANSIEGIWQGLKVFETEDIDSSKFLITDMKGLKRTVRKYGKPKGHRKGVKGEELLDYVTARQEIYIPAYRWVLENKLHDVIDTLIKIADESNVVLLDYDLNSEVKDTSRPLSHASIIKKYLEEKAPRLCSEINNNKASHNSISKSKFKKSNSVLNRNTSHQGDGQLEIWS